MLNYVEVTGLRKGDDGFLEGVRAVDHESGDALELRGKVVVNATGVFTDGVRALDEPAARPII